MDELSQEEFLTILTQKSLKNRHEGGALSLLRFAGRQRKEAGLCGRKRHALLKTLGEKRRSTRFLFEEGRGGVNRSRGQGR